MKDFDFIVRPIRADEIDKAADLLATAYYDDIFFKWCVDRDEDHQQIVAEYYKVYLRSRGCMACVAESAEMGMIGASVWLPHDADASLHEDIERVVGAANVPMFREVAERSHANEPANEPFYQLVGFGVLKEVQGRGVGHALLKHQLDIFDRAGVATYLEASTPYHGGGVYGKFGYQLFSELMVFTDTAVLYPLYRAAQGKEEI